MATLLDKQRIDGILEALHDQRKLSRFCDVVLRVCGEEIFAHSNVLAAASPYFGSFLGQGQDLPRAFSQKTPQVIEIHIDGSDGDSGYGEAVRKVVDFMYTSNIDLTVDIVSQVLEISKIMQMDPITVFCESFQQGFRGQKVTPLADVTDCTNDFYNSLIAVNTKKEIDVSNMGSGIKSKPGNEILKPGKRRRGRPRKKTKEEESDDEFSAFVSLVTNEEERQGEEKEIIDKENEEDDDKAKENNKEGPLLRRTRGKRAITSYLTAARSSSRLRSKGPRFKSDYVMHPLKRLKRSPQKGSKTKDGDGENDDGEKDSKLYSKEGGVHFGKGRNYKCDKCDFKSKKVKEMGEHKKQHLHDENICSFCDYQGTDEEDFKTHLEKHEGPEPFFCKFCDSKFKSRTQLNTHLPKHRDDKPFVCHLCLAGFKWKHALKNHMITHSVTKDHLCDICGFATAHKSQLKAHRLIHTGETFKCDFEGCTFEATKRQNLRYHILTHTHEKPHQCEICGHSFSLIKNMKRHMLLHSDVRPYSCGQCSFSTTRYDKLKEHMLKQHSLGDPPTKKHRLSDYQEDNKNIIGDEVVSQETLQTMANLAAACAEDNQGETQIFSTVGGVPIVARVQYAEINSQGVIQYVAQVE